MKKRLNLPDHLPNSNSWEALRSTLEVDAQLKREAANLPEHHPGKNVWPAVEAQLEQARVRMAWWKWTGMAAAIAGIGLMMVVLLMDKKAPIQHEYLVTSISSQDIPWKTTMPQKPTSHKEEAGSPTPTVMSAKEPVNIHIPPVSLDRSDVPQLHMPILPAISPDKGSGALAENTMSQDTLKPAKSFHQVNISWGINDRIKLKTDYAPNTARQQPKLHQVAKSPGKLVLRLSSEK
ncbi:hypothetical protein [Echinicola rosea]|uniref:Uncharacterized protein n=1 Tax=Echinicola rosea TaxID=1807691 RepID=A0ABQ1UQR8_9BACT|nr:hypothetical protein [Echinicola rosea]GGF23830.1 hypothetical protein GCM10011339_09910 [Echinicola rosea]